MQYVWFNTDKEIRKAAQGRKPR